MNYLSNGIRSSILNSVNLEDFFTKQVKSELNQAGYKADIYYHAFFTVGDLLKGCSLVREDLIYKR